MIYGYDFPLHFPLKVRKSGNIKKGRVHRKYSVFESLILIGFDKFFTVISYWYELLAWAEQQL